MLRGGGVPPLPGGVPQAPELDSALRAGKYRRLAGPSRDRQIITEKNRPLPGPAVYGLGAYGAWVGPDVPGVGGRRSKDKG